MLTIPTSTLTIAAPVVLAGETTGIRLNNLVIEHFRGPVPQPEGERDPTRPAKTLAFEAAKEGWVFIALRSGPTVRVCLDSTNPEDAVVTDGRHEAGRRETMRFVRKGKHTVRVFLGKDDRVEELIVRSVPEILLFPVSFAAWEKETSANYGHRKDWDFFKRHMLRDANVVTFFNAEDFQPYLQEWRAGGGKALIKKNIPYYSSTADQIYEDWGRPLEQWPNLDGLTIDEFGPSEEHQKLYGRWLEVFDRIAENPRCKGKAVYSFWGSAAPREEMRSLVEATQRLNFRWLHEGCYMLRKSEGDVAGQMRYITGWGGNKFEQMQKMFPELIENHLLYVFGISDYHWAFDLAPELDFRVFLDLRFHHIANHPGFRDMYGIGLYSLNSATEEICRHASALVRHYCIEARRDRFNNDPLEPGHILNPGFEEGTERWQVRPAEAGSVKTIATADLPYKNTVTHRAVPHEKMALCTTRSATRPNEVSQPIRNLTPGRLYSVRVMVSDLTDTKRADELSPEHITKLVPISVNVEGGDILEDQSIDRPWTTQFARAVGDGKMTLCWNFRFRVFRASGSEAVLRLSDWSTPDAPGGEVDHKVIWDFLEVQPHCAHGDMREGG